MSSIDDATARPLIHGTCDPKFQAVADAFEANFASRDEVGASVAMTVEGETVVDPVPYTHLTLPTKAEASSVGLVGSRQE